MIGTYAVIVGDIVVNMVVWDGETEWHPSEGFAVKVPDDSYVSIGWKYIDGVFINPLSTVEPSNGEILNAKMAELAERLRVDIERMNLAYLSAIVVDGASEDGKIAKIRQEISLRKQKHKDDIAALILEYGD